MRSSSETTPPDEGGGVPNRLLGATISGVRWISLARVAGELIAIGSLVVLARLITPAEFGAFAVALVVTELALTIPGEGVGTALVQKELVAKEHLEAAFFLSLLIGLLLGAAAFVAAPHVFTPLFGSTTTELVRIATPMFLIASLTAVPMATAQRRLDFRLIGLAQIAALIVRAGTSVALALVGLNGSALMIGMLAGATATLGVLLTTERLPWPRPHRRGIREIAGFGVPAALSGMTWTGFRNSDFAIVAARLGALDAGLYWRAYQLAIEYQRKIGSAVHQVTFPVYSRAADAEEMFELRRRVVRLVGALLVPGLAGLAVVAPVFVPWVFGEAWSAAVGPTQVLAIAGMVTVASDTLGAVVLASGRARAWLAYHVCCLLSYVAAVYVASGYGLMAVCAGVVVVQTLGTVAGYGLLLRGLVQQPLRRLAEDIGPGAAGAAATAASSWLVLRGLPEGLPAPVTLLVVAVLGAVSGLLAIRQLAPSTWADVAKALKRLAPQTRITRRRPPVAPNAGFGEEPV